MAIRPVSDLPDFELELDSDGKFNPDLVLSGCDTATRRALLSAALTP
jgi:hypothetical protein